MDHISGVVYIIPVIGPKKRRLVQHPVAAAILVGCLLTLFSVPSSRAYASCWSSVASQGACSGVNSLTPAKVVLRKVVHRKPVAFRPHAHVPEYLLVYCVETLECGHTLTTFPQADPLIAVRRRCGDCDSVGVPKKPPMSVKLSRLEVRKVA